MKNIEKILIKVHDLKRLGIGWNPSSYKLFVAKNKKKNIGIIRRIKINILINLKISVQLWTIFQYKIKINNKLILKLSSILTEDGLITDKIKFYRQQLGTIKLMIIFNRVMIWNSSCGQHRMEKKKWK